MAPVASTTRFSAYLPQPLARLTELPLARQAGSVGQMLAHPLGQPTSMFCA
jgi:hypothetical protein